ncbi:HEAT repeat domain-containing protein [Ramlibacter tataouinensis]|uniref:HEAT repeat domain-containing protein n=1 Tax=Ramlibacter tataouinensis TaxID=94132 RepID=UPI0022F3B923|nr:HEAT repeat domain-containing protein [Ramlibacter tataouinensis]WBY02220.1 HEAT repeat domain-containing protein [Ramlibacter tataouinensis]
MAFSWLSDPYLILAAWAGTVSAVLVLLLAVLILALRANTRGAQARWQAFIAHWRPQLLAAVSATEAAGALLPPLHRRDRRHFLRLWLYLHESLRGEAAQRLNEAALALHMPRWGTRLLARGSDTDRVLAALALGRLQWQPAWPVLLRATHSRDPLLSVSAARALVQIDPLEGVRQLLPLLLGRTDWDVSRVGEFLGGARQAFWLALTRHLPGAPPAQVARGLQLAGALRLELPDTALRPMLQATWPAPVIRAAVPLAARRALAPAIIRLLEHPDWQVREAAVAALARFAVADELPLLERRLEDERFEVRLTAARALAALPFVQEARLRALAATSNAGGPVLQQVIAEMATGERS